MKPCQSQSTWLYLGHFLPKSWENLAERFGEPDWPWMKHLGCGKAVLMIGYKDFRPVCSATWDARKRLERLWDMIKRT